MKETGAASRLHQTTRDLTARQRLLLEIMREYQFGRVENMPVRSGQPILDHDVRVVRVARLGCGSSATRIPRTNDFELKEAVCDLFDELAQLGNGMVGRLEFRHGLPCLIEIAVATSAPLVHPQCG